MNSERLNNLKAWVHWVLKNPLDEHQEEHANATNDLFSLAGTLEHKLIKAQEEISNLKQDVKIISIQCNEWERLANEWREDYDKLKAKYEPMVAVTREEKTK